MNECSAFAWTKAALWDGLGFDEGAEFVVGGGWWASLIVAEQLPFGDGVELGFCFELRPIREGGAFCEAAVDELRAGGPTSRFSLGLALFVGLTAGLDTLRLWGTVTIPRNMEKDCKLLSELT